MLTVDGCFPQEKAATILESLSNYKLLILLVPPPIITTLMTKNKHHNHFNHNHLLAEHKDSFSKTFQVTPDASVIFKVQ